MLCCTRLKPPSTLLPGALRNQLGSLLQGPPHAAHRQQRGTCLFALGRLGDFVLALSALRLLLRELGPEDCTLVVPAPLASLAQDEFAGVRYLTLPTEAASLSWEIVPIWLRERPKFAADRFARLVCLSHQRSLYYELALSWVDAGRDMRLMPETYPQAPAQGLSMELLAHWRLVEGVLGRRVAREEILPRFASVAPSDGRNLLVCPLSRDPTRNLPGEFVVGILRDWRRRSTAPIALGGSPADAQHLNRLAALARKRGIEGICVDTPHGLSAMLDQVARAGAVFATDSAPAHAAAALDKPSVIVTNRYFHGYAQPWSRSERQQAFMRDTPTEQIAAALPCL